MATQAVGGLQGPTAVVLGCGGPLDGCTSGRGGCGGLQQLALGFGGDKRVATGLQRQAGGWALLCEAGDLLANQDVGEGSPGPTTWFPL